MKAFISYSHHDSGALERLHVHLAPLRREGRLEAWFDREILAGDALNEKIKEQLESCGLFLLLISPDFLNSDYCVETEMTRALERHDAGDARVVPIIVEPCDWTSSRLRALKALPNDGKPVSEWTNPNTAYLKVVQELRRILDREPPAQTPSEDNNTPDGQEERLTSPRRYRAKREFDDIDKAEYREHAFAIIREYFRNAIGELNSVEGLRGRYTDLSDTSFGCVIVNRGLGYGTAHLTVHGGRGRSNFGDIYYSFSEDAANDSANGWFNIEADEFELNLRASMGLAHDVRAMSPEAAAEAMWTEILQHAGISYD